MKTQCETVRIISYVLALGLMLATNLPSALAQPAPQPNSAPEYVDVVIAIPFVEWSVNFHIKFDYVDQFMLDLMRNPYVVPKIPFSDEGLQKKLKKESESAPPQRLE